MTSGLPAPGELTIFGPSSHLLRAHNPGLMTLDGTNTYFLSAPGSPTVLLVDPGPDEARHLDAIEAALAGLGKRLDAVALTHFHFDHSEAAPIVAAKHGVGILALDPNQAAGDEQLAPGDELRKGGLTIDVVATPGHSSDSVCLLVREEGLLLTGDTVLGRGTTVVADPDGTLGEYLDSLEKLKALTGVERILPGHGPVLDEPAKVLDYYLNHRHERLAQVREAVLAGAKDAQAVVETVYVDVDKTLWGAALMSVRAQLQYLREREGLETGA